MGSPAVFSGSRTKLLSSKGLLLKDGTTIDNDGVRNYIKGGNAEGSAIGVAYSNTAGTSPVTGSGGSPTVSFARTTTNPLSGTASFLFTKPASNTQGQGWSWDFTIDPIDKAKVLQISFDYLVASGTFVAGNPTDRTSAGDSDLTVWIYDVTNSVLIQPSTYRLYSNSTTIADKFVANFQSASNSTSYRLIVHCGSTSTSAFTAKFDNVAVTPSTYVYGTPITDWQAYTPTISGFGTVSSVDFKSRRVGDTLEVQGKFTAGTVAASAAQVTLGYAGANANVTQDTNKIASNSQVGTYGTNAASTTWFGSGSVLATAGANYLSFSPSSSTVSVLLGANGNLVTGTGNFVTFFARVPITGWSSSVQMSDSADTRVVSFSGSLASSVTAGTNITITALKDSHSASTGTQYNVPVPGDYIVTGGGVLSAGGSLQIMKNGAFVQYLSSANAGAASGGSVTLENLKTTDNISIQSTTTQTVTAGRIGISRISGPSAIAATETIAARYTDTSGGAIGTAEAVYKYTTKDFDSHGAYSTSTGLFTAPASGLYSISAMITTASVILSAAQNLHITIYKNGTNYSFLNQVYGNGSVLNWVAAGSSSIRLNAGDTVGIYVGNSVATTAYTATGILNRFEITRIGL